jgi:hypothetical protein
MLYRKSGKTDSALRNSETPLYAFYLGPNGGNGAILRDLALHESRHMAIQAAHIRFEIDEMARHVAQFGLNRLERFEQEFVVTLSAISLSSRAKS